MRAFSLIFLLLCSLHTAANTVYRPAPWVGLDLSGAPCIGGQGVGPLDYTSPKHRQSYLFSMVVGAHFNDQVRTLKGSAKTSGNSPVNDLDYTLRGIPNHHQALYSMMNYQLDKNNAAALRHSGKPAIACYLNRAINFSTKDHVPQMLLGILYARKALFTKALEKYKSAEQLAPENSGLHYNLGLLYLKMDNKEDALVHAKKAYKLGYPLQGLKKKLIKLGVWD